MSAQAHADHGAPSSFVRRWLYSTNHKDIGTMYLVFAILAAFIGGGLSVYMRMELMSPGRSIHGQWARMERFYHGSWLDHGVFCCYAWAYWRLW